MTKEYTTTVDTLMDMDNIVYTNGSEGLRDDVKHFSCNSCDAKLRLLLKRTPQLEHRYSLYGRWDSR